MRKDYAFLMMVIALSNFAFAQQKNDQVPWRLIVVDSVTTKGIDRATISLNGNQNFKTDGSGTIYIKKSLVILNSTIAVSCIGYKLVSYKLPANSTLPDTIRLTPSITTLNEVKIGLHNPGVKIGLIKKQYNTHRVTSTDGSYAQYIPNEKMIKGTITSIEYGLNDELHGIEKPFRARLYIKGKDSITLDKELTKDSIIVYNPEKKRRVSVDISKYNIQLPANGVIVVFETLSAAYYSKDVTIYKGQEYIKTPGIDMEQTKNYWRFDNNKTNRSDTYSMVGPPADRWNWNDAHSQRYVYMPGNDFAMSVTIRQ